MTDQSVLQARARFWKVAGAITAALVVLSTAGTHLNARHAPTFVATDLGTLGTLPQDGSTSEAFGVNDKGLVTGVSTLGSDPKVFHAFVWSEDTGLTDLGTLLDSTQSSGTAINNNGAIVGFGPNGQGGPVHAFVRTRADGLVDLSTLGGSTTTPAAINAKGDVVGSSDLADGTFHAFLWTKQDGILDLGTLGGLTSGANAISDRGTVVGDSLNGKNVSHAFMWTRQAGMVDLGTLVPPTISSSVSSSAQAVSDDGVIVGFSQTDQVGSNGQPIEHAFVWTRRTRMVDIGTRGLDSFAEKIAGRFVIGHLTLPSTATATENTTTHGFVWTQEFGFVDIGTLDGDVGSLVVGVNDRGMVAGNSFSGIASRAFVWSRSSGIVPLETPAGGSSHANAMNGDFIVGASCDANLTCHATLWKPSVHARKDRSRNGDDEDED
jgi:probable HAF family extracellular repeat protein